MPANSRRTLTTLALLLLAIPGVRAGAAGRPASPPADETAPEIRIIRRSTAGERARREHEEERRRAAARLRLAPWCRAYPLAVAPVRAHLEEALASLAIAWGPASRNLGYPLRQALAAVPSRLPLPAPDPLVDRRLRSALLLLQAGAEALERGLPTVAQMRLYEGRRRLFLTEETLRGYGLEPQGEPCAGSTGGIPSEPVALSLP